MKDKILKVGFGYLILTIIVIGITLLFNNGIDNQLQEMTTMQEQDDVPLQNAVGDNELIASVEVKKKTTNKTKKKTTKKVVAKKYKKSKIRKVNTPTASVSEYQNYAHDLVINKYGWSEYDFQCLVKLWNRESGWNPLAENKKSKARGIPQSLPVSKMASEGADYMTNGYTQIRWGLKYIKGRYGSPAKAWAHSQKKGWY